jgi:hypothetical protein
LTENNALSTPPAVEKGQVTKETSFLEGPVPENYLTENKGHKKCAFLASGMLLFEAHVESIPNWPVHSAG